MDSRYKFFIDFIVILASILITGGLIWKVNSKLFIRRSCFKRETKFIHLLESIILGLLGFLIYINFRNALFFIKGWLEDFYESNSSKFFYMLLEMFLFYIVCQFWSHTIHKCDAQMTGKTKYSSFGFKLPRLSKRLRLSGLILLVIFNVVLLIYMFSPGLTASQ